MAYNPEAESNNQDLEGLLGSELWGQLNTDVQTVQPDTVAEPVEYVASTSRTQSESKRSRRQKGEFAPAPQTPERGGRGPLMLGVVACTGLVLFGIHQGSDSVLGFHVVSMAGISQGGTAEVTSVDMKEQVILETHDTNAKDVQVEFQDDVSLLGFHITANHRSLMRKATVRTHLLLDPGKVELDYDPNKKNYKNLTVTIPDASLSTDVYELTGTQKSYAPQGSLTALPSQITADVLDTVAGKANVDPASIPVLGYISSGETSIDNGLENIADLDIVNQVDKECTPKLMSIPDFQKQLSLNALKAVQGELYDSRNAGKPGFKKLSAFYALTPTQRNKVIENATVDMSKQTVKSAKDAENQALLDKYFKTGMFVDTTNAATIPNMVCGVDKSTKLKNVSAGN